MKDNIRNTVALLQQRFRENGDFPMFSHTMQLISKQTSSGSDATITDLTNTILNDYALSNKILKLINSVFYSQFQLGEKISTISRAVFILGFEQIRNIALSMKLFDHLLNQKASPDVKDNILMSFMSGIIARNMAGKVDISDTEDVFICAMFYNLGKLLAVFYLPEEAKKIKYISMKKGINEEIVAQKILGISYTRLGISIAKGWQFPDRIVNSMIKLPTAKVETPDTVDMQFRVLTSFSNELSSMVNNMEGSPDRQREELNSLIQRFDNCFIIDEEELIELVNSSVREMDEYSNLYKIDLRHSTFVHKMSRVSKGEQIDDIAEAETVMPASGSDLDLLCNQGIDITAAQGISELDEKPENILTVGIQDVTNSLLGNYSINDILRMILEIMYRGLNSTRALICIRNTQAPVMEGRFGFGADIDFIIKIFRFKIENSRDIFNIALRKESEVYVKDVKLPHIKPHIPKWYLESIRAETLLILPLIVNNTPLGIIYADNYKAGCLNVEPQQLTLLKTLRNQAVMAVKQKML